MFQIGHPGNGPGKAILPVLEHLGYTECQNQQRKRQRLQNSADRPSGPDDNLHTKSESDTTLFPCRRIGKRHHKLPPDHHQTWDNRGRKRRQLPESLSPMSAQIEQQKKGDSRLHTHGQIGLDPCGHCEKSAEKQQLFCWQWRAQILHLFTDGNVYQHQCHQHGLDSQQRGVVPHTTGLHPKHTIGVQPGQKDRIHTIAGNAQNRRQQHIFDRTVAAEE